MSSLPSVVIHEVANGVCGKWRKLKERKVCHSVVGYFEWYSYLIMYNEAAGFLSTAEKVWRVCFGDTYIYVQCYVRHSLSGHNLQVLMIKSQQFRDLLEYKLFQVTNSHILIGPMLSCQPNQKFILYMYTDHLTRFTVASRIRPS